MLKHLEKLSNDDLKKKNSEIVDILKNEYNLRFEDRWFEANFRQKTKKKIDNVILKVRKSCGITILRKKINEKDDKNAECQSPVNLKSSFVKSYSTHA